MKISVLGTGMVGNSIASKLMTLGHEVMMGARTTSSANGLAWQAQYETSAYFGDFAQAAQFAEVIFIAVRGDAVLAAAEQAGVENTAGKVVIDVTNPLDFSQGMPPTLIPSLSNTTSSAEEIQKVLPQAKVVKTLNTMTHSVMVNPALVAGQHDVFVSGDDVEAKAVAIELLKSFGWDSPFDLGGLATARGTEGMMPFWLSLWGALGHANFNYSIVGKERV